MAIRLEEHFDEAGEGFNELVVLFDDDHWTATQGSARASLVFDARDGRLHWSSRERPGSTGESAKRELIVILSMAGGDEQAREQIIAATERAKRIARKRIRQLRATGDAADARVARLLENEVKSDWLRRLRQ